MPLLGSRGAASLTGFGGLAKLGYLLRNSLRFRASNSNYLSRTFGSATSTTTGTFSFWMKRGKVSNNYQYIWSASNYDLAYFDASDNLWIAYLSNLGYVNTNAVFRDPSAWYHVMIVFDTTNATAANRLQVYVNGVAQSLNWGSTPQTQNATFQRWNVSGYTGDIGDVQFNHTSYFDGYLAEYYWIDGQALTPSSFGKTDPVTGQWIPIKYSGTYGTNGFYLPFTNTTSTSTLGNDFSGNGNTWTVNNFSLTAGATYDSMTDVPTLTSATAANYCVMNPLVQTTNLNLTNGNLTITGTGSYSTSPATFGMSSGKWYWEYTCTTYSVSGDTHYGIGTSAFNVYQNTWIGSTSAGWIYAASNGNKYNNNSAVAYGSAFTSGDIIGVAFDADNGTLTFYKNNTSQGTAYTGLTSGPYFPVATVGTSNITNANFGQRPFAYTPPSGYVALNSFNLP